MLKNLPIVVPISFPLVDWNNFISYVYSYSDRSPTKLLDNENMKVGDLSSFIGAIGYFSSGKSPNDSIRYTPSILEHLSFTFLIEGDLSLDILRETKLKVTDNSAVDRNVLCIVSGNLLDWKQAIIVFTNEQRDPRVRYIFDAVFLYFRQLGLQDVFFTNKRTEFKDQTFQVS